MTSLFRALLKRLDLLLPIISIIVIFSVWQYFSINGQIPKYIAPSPSEIILRLYKDFSVFAAHGKITLSSILIGFSGGMVFGISMAILSTSYKTVRFLFEPVLIVSQVIPKVAIAPILIVLLGSGIESRAIVAALICFFPFYSNTVQGIYSVSKEMLFQLNLAGKSGLEVLFKVKLLYAMPFIVAAAKTSVLLAVIGVIVGEFLGVNTGLGNLILIGNARFDSELAFASIFLLSIIGATLFITISLSGLIIVRKLRLNDYDE